MSGTHEELFDMLRLGKADLVLSDPRRAFSDDYVNLPIYTGYCFVELSAHHPLAQADCLSMERLRALPCILVSSKDQRQTEQTYHRDVLGIVSPFVFAENLEKARLLVAGGRGYLPLLETSRERAQTDAALKRIPLYKNDDQLRRCYYAFWKKSRTTPLIEAFAAILGAQFPAPEA